MPENLTAIADLLPKELLIPELVGNIDFTDENNDQLTMRVIILLCLVVTVLITAARTMIRIRINGTVFWEDIVTIIAAAFNLILCSLILYSVNLGVGKHIWFFPSDRIIPMLHRLIKLMMACQVFYAIALGLTKISIMILYHRIFPAHGLRLAIYIMSGFLIIFTVASVLVTIFQCRPVSGAWNFLSDRRQCIDYTAFLYAHAALTIATDTIIVIMPLPSFWKLQIPTRQKIVLSVLFILGGFACIASIIRITHLNQVDNLDISYRISLAILWSAIECTIGIFCVCVPPLRPIFARFLPASWAGHSSSNTQQIYEMSSGVQTKSKTLTQTYTGMADESEVQAKSGQIVVQTDLYTTEEVGYVSNNDSTEELNRVPKRSRSATGPRSVDLIAASKTTKM